MDGFNLTSDRCISSSSGLKFKFVEGLYSEFQYWGIEEAYNRDFNKYLAYKERDCKRLVGEMLVDTLLANKGLDIKLDIKWEHNKRRDTMDIRHQRLLSCNIYVREDHYERYTEHKRIEEGNGDTTNPNSTT